MTSVNQFYNLAHIFISLFGAILLLTIYYNIRRHFYSLLVDDNNHKRVDKGLMYLSFALFTWVVSGLWYFSGEYFDFVHSFTFRIGVYLLSIINTLFFLLALFYFDNAPEFIYKNEKNIKKILFLFVFITLSTLFISYFLEDVIYSNIRVLAIPDLLLSGFLTYLLFISFYRTFVQRGLKWVAYISMLILFSMFISQIPEGFIYFDNEFINKLIKLIAKTSLISLFLVLATSWVIELANTPKIKEIQIRFIDWALIELSIPSKNIVQEHIDFGSKTTQYKNLLKFAVKRKFGLLDNQSILIGPLGEISNQTYLSRIIDNINDILDLKKDEKLDRKDLFTFLGEGKYRIRILPQNISIQEDLLSEFKRDVNLNFVDKREKD